MAPDSQKFSEDGLFFFDDPTIHENLNNRHPSAPVLDEFLRMLAICHTVIPEVPADSDAVSDADADVDNDDGRGVGRGNTPSYEDEPDDRTTHASDLSLTMQSARGHG